MAETNHTSSATNNDCNASSLSVAPNANPAPEGLTRRTLMNVMSAVAAAPAVASIPTAAKSTPMNHANWNAACSRYQRADAEYHRLSSAHDVAQTMCDKEMGEPNPEFAAHTDGAYLLPRNRDDLIRHIETSIATKDYRGKQLSPDDRAAIARKATLLVDERDAYRTKYDETYGRLVSKLDHAWQEALSRRNEAMGDLLETPAPDNAAIRMKAELLLSGMKEADADGADHFEAVVLDLRRLLNAVN